MRAPRAIAPVSATVTLDPSTLPDEPITIAHRFALLPTRARRALEIGLRTAEPLHIFVSSAAELMLEDDLVLTVDELSRDWPPAPEVIYVSDDSRGAEPRCIVLPAPRGSELADGLAAVGRSLRRKLEALGGDDRVRDVERRLGKELSAKVKETMSSLDVEAKKLGFGVKSIGNGLQTFPILHGKPVSPEQFEVLDERTKKNLEDAEEQLGAAVSAAANRIRTLTEDVEEERDAALARVVDKLVEEDLAKLRESYADIPEVDAHLARVAREITRDFQRYFDPRSARGASPFAAAVVVARDETERGAPVVFEGDPTPARLFGNVLRRVENGVLVADLEGLRAGSLAGASGGILLIRAEDVLDDPAVWSRLKRSLREGRVDLVDGVAASAVAATFAPEPLPIDTRVVLLGSDPIFEALLAQDIDFGRLFRVKVEVEESIRRDDEGIRGLDGYLMGQAKRRSLLPFDRAARARLIDLATRIAGVRDELALDLAPLEETFCFASEQAAAEGAEIITRAHIDAAWDERRERRSAMARFAREQILRGELFIDTDGTRVGVVNGLAVVSVNDVDFGQPMRITAVVSLGNEGLVDVEREAQLGGAVHTKGVAILRGLLSFLFGQERPLSLRAQITFEQSYGEIDGDSASSTELFAILSALADVPLDQGIAVTGSINQLGEMQPIGGVCAKIEAFYDLCVSRGLNGHQGCLIPQSNLRHLVLRDDVADAIAKGTFHVYAAHTIAEGIEVLSNVTAGVRDEAGRFPAESVFGRVERRLIDLAERLRKAEGGRGGEVVSEQGEED